MTEKTPNEERPVICTFCEKTDSAIKRSGDATYGEVFCDHCDLRLEIIHRQVRRNLEDSRDRRSWFERNPEFLLSILSLIFWYYAFKYLQLWLDL